MAPFMDESIDICAMPGCWEFADDDCMRPASSVVGLFSTLNSNGNEDRGLTVSYMALCTKHAAEIEAYEGAERSAQACARLLNLAQPFPTRRDQPLSDDSQDVGRGTNGSLITKS